jgi:hypothetical protein
MRALLEASSRRATRVRVGLWLSRGWLGLRVGRRYFKLRDVRRHPLLFSERNRLGYRRLAAAGEHWELGVSARAPEGPR